MMHIDRARLLATTQLCHVLAHECYFEFLTQVYRRNGSCKITPEGEVTAIQRRSDLQYGVSSLTAAAGLSYNDADIRQVTTVCSKAGFIAGDPHSPSACPLIHLAHLTDCLMYQIELLGGSVYNVADTSELETLPENERALLAALSSQRTQYILFALRGGVERSMRDIAAAVRKDSEGAYTGDVRKSDSLLQANGSRGSRTYAIVPSVRTQTIRLMNQLLNHFIDE
ncbi:MAG TPA: hypothetical protein VNG90_04780 [Candidatus Acidoferrum sp.]|nr:hypothetical protein [Candidatus Acidoferrum sp.]